MKIDFDEKLSPHFTVGEMLRSGTAIRLGIKNVPEEHPEDGLTNEEVVENLRQLAVKVLEPLRQRVGRVIVTSGYRCRVLNRAVGGVATSQHLCGQAADIHVTGNEMCRKYARIIRQLTPFDQLILESAGLPQKRWIHVSYRPKGRGSVGVSGPKTKCMLPIRKARHYQEGPIGGVHHN
ncbi:hypothetical protein GCM10019997_22050 [Prevotella corporis]|uniref:D-Ala-D-Ala carboxypeptidase family metallohydrolase n=2 Tax=Prevotella corporis TaxID=28128 RepID=UPI00041805B6|nr:D-Ala-D-Ala carboxypeptidase family metallohydrolase [Prevotella corporis]